MYIVNEGRLLPNILWMDSMNRLDGIYAFAVKEMQQNLDRRQFGYDLNSLLKDREQSQWNNDKEMKLFIETTVKWRSMMEKNAEIGEGKRCKSGECPSANRISFVMSLFKGHFLEQMVYDKESGKKGESHYLDLFTQCLGGYGAVSLLNDYDHIRSEHTRNANDRLRDCKEPGIDTECCRSLRTLRRRTNTANRNVNDDQKSVNRNFMNSLDDQQQWFLMDLSIKIHSFLNHTESEEDEQKEDEMKNEDDGPFDAKETVSKFVNEIDGGVQTEEQSTKMDGLSSCLDRGGASNEQSIAVQN